MNLIFDFSGTLALEGDLPRALTDATLRAHGGEGITVEAYRAEFALPVGPFYARRLPGIPLDDIEATFARLTRERYPREALWVHGAREVLPCLARRHRLFVFSTLDTEALQATLQVAGLGSVFTAVQGGVGDKRLSLPGFLKAWDLHPDETAYVGDTLHDLEAAHAAGISGWAALWGEKEEGREHGDGSDGPMHRESSRWTEVRLGDFASLEAEVAKREAAASRAYPITTVGAWIVDAAGEVLLVRTRKWSGKWGIPGGKVDYGETLEAALRREVREETGLEADAVRFLMAQDAVESKEFYRPRHFVLLNYAVRVAGLRPVFRLNHESLEGRWMPVHEAEGLDLNAPTRVLLQAWNASPLKHF